MGFPGVFPQLLPLWEFWEPVKNFVNKDRMQSKVAPAILKNGHDENFAPEESEEFDATNAPAGSEDKIEIMRRRIAQGVPLWHRHDRTDYSGLTGAVHPRE